ncbi:unnamed protein product [Caenorhabditis auriculariae]|uniref:Uncharacterized protein n=1 Tax=Caenorhabditis auriculariae TaxID=2777116 RepID=A0A8S1HQK3_9PELO|nr:unnamed protein product [Caenorhabditis auriculariae]
MIPLLLLMLFSVGLVEAAYDPESFPIVVAYHEREGHRYMIETDMRDGKVLFTGITVGITFNSVSFGQLDSSDCTALYNGLDASYRCDGSFFLLHTDHMNMKRQIANEESDVCKRIVEFGGDAVGLLKTGARKNKLVGTFNKEDHSFYYYNTNVNPPVMKHIKDIFHEIERKRIQKDSFEVLCLMEHNYDHS